MSFDSIEVLFHARSDFFFVWFHIIRNFFVIEHFIEVLRLHFLLETNEGEMDSFTVILCGKVILLVLVLNVSDVIVAYACCFVVLTIE